MTNDQLARAETGGLARPQHRVGPITYESSMTKPTSLILGIHPGNGHSSINSYYELCLAYLPACLPEAHIVGHRPADGTVGRVSPMRGRCQNYIEWPIRLAGLQGQMAHVVDQNITWYRRFLFIKRSIVTVHDLINYMVAAGVADWGHVPPKRRAMAKYCAGLIREYDRIIAVSTNTADDLVRHLEIPAKRIDVIPNTLPSEYLQPVTGGQGDYREEVFGDAEVALLHVGKPSIYKNRLGVLRVLAHLRRNGVRAKVAVTGASLTEEEFAYASENDLHDSISTRIADSRTELRRLFRCADVLIFPSVYEGFGWPPLEAMACGCPVITSGAGSLREVVGEGGIIVSDPHNVAEMAHWAVAIARDLPLRQSLQRSGARNVSRFTPAIVAPQIAEIYRSVINDPT